MTCLDDQRQAVSPSFLEIPSKRPSACLSDSIERLSLTPRGSFGSWMTWRWSLTSRLLRKTRGLKLTSVILRLLLYCLIFRLHTPDALVLPAFVVVAVRKRLHCIPSCKGTQLWSLTHSIILFFLFLIQISRLFRSPCASSTLSRTCFGRRS